MSESGSYDSQFDSITPVFDQSAEETSHYSPVPLQGMSDLESERPIVTKMGEKEFGFEENPEYVVPEVKQQDKPKRKFLRKGEGIARFTPGAKSRAKPVMTKQTSITTRKEEPTMKRVLATTKSVPKLAQKHTNYPLQVTNTPPQRQKAVANHSAGISPIPFTPPSYLMGTPTHNLSEFQTPPLSIETRTKTVSFKSADDNLLLVPPVTSSNLFRIPSDDSVLLGFMRNEIQQQDDLKEFEALEALIEAHVNGETSFDIDLNAPMDSPAFHALGEKAKRFSNKQPAPAIHITSPVSVANSSAYQNPLNDARFEDEELGWADVLGDGLQHEFPQKRETYNSLHQTVVTNLPPVAYDANNYESNLVSAPKETGGEISKLLQERVEELENEITEYQRLNGMIRKEEGERKRLHNEYRQKMDEFEEYKKSELERMEKDYQNQMLVVKRERQRLEQYKQTHQTSESKLLKQEIEILREQLSETQGIFREKESRQKGIVQRLKDNIRQIEFERDELKEQNKLLESLRLKQWETTTDSTNTSSRHARTKLKFDTENASSNEEIAWTRSEEMEDSTQIFSDSSSESCNEEHNEPTTLGSTLNEMTNFTDTSKSYVNSTPIPGHVDKLSERILPDKSTEILYFNNTRKLISPNGKMVTLYLSNGDIKTMSEDRTIYLYSENGTKHTKYKSGKEIFEYSTGQREIVNTDGSKEMFFPDGNRAILFADGSEKVTCKDGTVQKKSADGNTTVVWHPDGFVDTMTTEYKKREFDDGTCKIVFKDGTNETRYPSGRVRIKNAKGEVIHDEIMSK